MTRSELAEKKIDDARVGAALRQLRKSLGFTLEEVGDAVGATYHQIWRIEQGESRNEVIRRDVLRFLADRLADRRRSVEEELAALDDCLAFARDLARFSRS